MKRDVRLLCTLFLLLAIHGAQANSLTWTNVSGGNWSTANNWSPNQVPANGDDVTITNAGSYTITNSAGVTLDDLILGGTNGIQTLSLPSLTLTNTGIVNSNGVLNWAGGDLEGSLTVLAGGVLSLSNGVTFAINNANAGLTNTIMLTNDGTVIWAGSATSYGNNQPIPHSGGTIIYNAGLWQAVADNTLSVSENSSNLFINVGTLVKTGGTGTSTINWPFNSTGTINTPSGTFTLNWSGTNTLNGNLTLTGSTIAVPLTIASNALLNLPSGDDLEGVLTVAQGGTLMISNSMTFSINNANLGVTNTPFLTNFGTVIWAGNATGYGNNQAIPHSGGTTIYNAGLWQSVGDNTFSVSENSSNLFINVGMLEKTGGVATSTLGWNFDCEGGTNQTLVGSFNIGNWIGTGLVHGTATYSGGTISGTFASDAAITFSATINGTMTISSNAVANWTGGDLEGSVTVAQGAALSISNSVTFAINNANAGRTNTVALTNNGTVVWAGNATSYGNNGAIPNSGGSIIYNAGLWQAVGDNSLNVSENSSNLFINVGTLEKTGGTGTSTINWGFNSTGTIDNLSGLFALNWIGPSILNGDLTLGGSTLTTPLTIASNAVLNLASGSDLEGPLTVLPGGILSISNGVTFAINNANLGRTNTLLLTNDGTVIWAGNVTSYGNNGAIPNSGGTIIYNAGLWQAVGDNSLNVSENSSNLFINVGTLEKTGGTSTSTINWEFDSAGGTLASPVGSFTFSIDWNANSVVQGNATVSGRIDGTIASNAVMNWTSGDLEGAINVAQGGTLSISNSVTFAINNANLGHTNTVFLTNNGTVIWACNGTSYGNNQAIPNSGGTIIYNAGLWQAVADNTLSVSENSSNLLINVGTLEKTGGSATSAIAWTVQNIGTLGSQTNTLSLTGNYDLSAGTLNTGINGPGNNGIVNLSGSPAVLAGTLSANFNNGYVAATGSSFHVLTYSAQTGTFTNFNLPFAVAWQTNYGSTTFTLTVLNVRPTLGAISNQTVDELSNLAVTATATDPDAGQSLVFALVSAPGNMTINPNTGAISWTPAQTQSPATNTILVSVTDNGTPPLSATNSFVVVVKEVNVPPSLPVISTQSVNELTLLTVVNTATNFNIHSTIIGYTLVNPPVGMSISPGGIITWTPAQTQSPSTNVITTIVTNSNPYDLVNPMLTSTNQFTVIVKEVNVAPTLPVIPMQTVNELTLLTVTNKASNFNIHSTIIGYALVNPPSNMVVSASGIITWTPAQAQSPSTNLITTIVTNSNPYDQINPVLTSTNQFTVIVKEVNVAPSLPAIPMQTVNELVLLTVTNTATNSNIHSSITGYTLVNPPSNMVVSASGIITWTPAQAQSPGTNVITTIVTNSNPYDLINPLLTSTNQFTVIVKEVNVAPVLPVIAGKTVNALALLTVTNTATESNIHATLGYTLVSPPAGVSISPGGVITWTPSRAQGPGTNTITTIVTNTDSFDTVNPHLSATNSFTVIVYAPTLAPIGNYTVNAGQTVTFTATATDNDPTRALTFSLVSPPAGATIDPASGLFNWRPGAATANSTNSLQVTVTDNSTPTLSDTKSFTVTVNPLAPVVLVPLGYANGQFKFQVNGTTGPDYIIMAGSALTALSDVATNLSPTTPFQFTDTNAILSPDHFYRVRLAP